VGGREGVKNPLHRYKPKITSDLGDFDRYKTRYNASQEPLRICTVECTLKGWPEEAAYALNRRSSMERASVGG